jgi:TonB family protein
MKTLKGLLLIMILGLVLHVPVMGQDITEEKECFEAGQLPEFPGGIEKLKEFFADNISYPEEAKKEGIQGKVFISFTVNKKGEVVNTEVVQRVHPTLDEEALRVIESMPAWIPGKKDGNPANVRVSLPVEFNLDSKQEE